MTQKKVLIFGGTTEGRRLTEYLAAQKVRTHVCVATDYGESLLPESEYVTRSGRRMDAGEMERKIREYDPAYVVDATHPYASQVSDHVEEACRACEKPYLRLLRQTKKGKVSHGTVRVENVEKAVRYLSGTKGNILVTTGSKEIQAFTELPHYQERVFARVLSLPSVVEKCQSLGLEGRHLICMQGPFSVEMNLAMLRDFKIRHLVTKEAGAAGGFPEKCLAAEKAGVELVVIGRPKEKEGLEEQELYTFLKEKLGLKTTWDLTIAGIGMGAEAGMTEAVKTACQEAGLLIGAGRMLQAAAMDGQLLEEAYRPEEILAALKKHPSVRKAAVVLSGDPGFYSGAKKLLEALKEEPDICARVLPGISSVSYLCARLGTSWEDAEVLSLHGREGNLIKAVEDHAKTIVLGSGAESVRKICENLKDYGFGGLTVTVGAKLSYPEEEIRSGTAEELTSYEGEGPLLLLIENPDGGKSPCVPGIPDEAFLRGKVPMTKEEVRCICLSKMRLSRTSVVYDVGAGTGSIAVEAARMADKGQVYAVERNSEGLELIRENGRNLKAENLILVPGEAPEVLEELPAPDCVFIGGSGGHLKEILETVTRKNPKVRVVLMAISLETMAEAKECLESFVHTEEEVVQIAVSRARKAGSYHLMNGQNPVFVFSFTCGKE